MTSGWEISGITRASTGFPVTLESDGDNSLMGSIPNGVNNHSLDLPDYNGAPLNLNGNPRNGLPYFNIAAFSPNALGTPGNASRRSFFGPGELNFDLALLKSFQFTEARALQFRAEAFNAFNHTQFLRARGGKRQHRHHFVRPGGERRSSPADAGRNEVHVLSHGRNG